MSEDRMLRAREVAVLLGLHVNTVKRISDRGDLRVFRVNTRGDRRYLENDVRAYIERLSR